MATVEPSAAAAKDATSVAGGQIMRSTLRGRSPAPRMIVPSTSAEALSPFIFQLPATSGRRPCDMVTPIAKSAQAVSKPAGMPPERPIVAAQGALPYDARPCGTRPLGGRLNPSFEERHATRYAQGFQQLAGADRHGGGAR